MDVGKLLTEHLTHLDEIGSITPEDYEDLLSFSRRKAKKLFHTKQPTFEQALAGAVSVSFKCGETFQYLKEQKRQESSLTL